MFCYCDLSVLSDKAIDPTYLLARLKNDGYATFALNYQFKDDAIFKPNTRETPQIENMNIYTRATFMLQNSGSLHQFGQQPVPYDIVAVQPVNQKMFHTVCTEVEPYEIITFDLGAKLPFMLKRNPVYQAIRRGKFFQISYSAMFDEDKRVICMTNIANIVKATNGKNLIISSGCSDHTTHRTPYDIAALLISLGMDKNTVLASMKENPQEVIRCAQHRKFLKGAIQEIPLQLGLKLGKRIQKHRILLKEKLKQAQKQLKKAE